ncbi:hypothetical protein VL15_08840 [Burkholderia cepacia]|uniref:Tli3-like domain-containing protein n=1 Tax=Burkholderia cepacia TaxID=292 RepID=A0A0J6A3Z7_BURCE|nr:hypothetical protein [Burkholderia cepacia]KML60485.1 hypothetical protein VL15_08840 [Burkholderia cepacia]
MSYEATDKITTCASTKPHQFYYLDVPQAKSAALADVLDFHGVRAIGEPTKYVTREGIRQQLGRGDVENYQGNLINADPTGKNLVFPASAPPHFATNDRGWTAELMYSTDGGKTFVAMNYMEHSFDPFEDLNDYVIAATRDKLFVAKK